MSKKRVITEEMLPLINSIRVYHGEEPLTGPTIIEQTDEQAAKVEQLKKEMLEEQARIRQKRKKE